MVVKVQAPRAGDGADAGQRALLHKRPTAATTHVRVNETHVSSLSLRQSVLVCGDACRALRLLPDGCVQTVVTSPPYWLCLLFIHPHAPSLISLRSTGTMST